MFAQSAPLEKRDAPVILDLRKIEKLEMNEILEHVLLRAREAKLVSGYSRMHHRHSRTSG